MRRFSKEEINTIKSMYKSAKNPDKQLEILAQLYACRVADIRRVLFAPQDLADTPPKKHAGNWRTDVGPGERLAAITEVMQGASVSSVARKCGISATTLSNWIREKNKKAPALGASGMHTLSETLEGYTCKDIYFTGSGFVFAFVCASEQGGQDMKLVAADVENLRLLEAI